MVITKRARASLVVVLLAASGLAACGSGSSTGSSTTGTSGATSAAGTSGPSPFVVATDSPPSCASTSGGPITPTLVPSRTSGVAPLVVFFDATATTSSSTSRPFHELGYFWDFGDPGSGTWSTGSRAGSSSRNAATGAIAAHLYETPGTYSVNMAVIDGTTGASSTCGIQITVQDPNAVFSGAKTVCFYNSSLGSGCPAGADTLATADFDNAMNYATSTGPNRPYRRILFKGGDTFAASSGVQLSVSGPGLLASYGAGKATINASGLGGSDTLLNLGSSSNDWRVSNVVASGPGGSSTVRGFSSDSPQTTFNALDLTGFYYGYYLDDGQPEHAIVNGTLNSISGPGSGGGSGYAGYVAASKYLAIMGTSASLGSNSNLTTTHLYRIWHGRWAVISNNTLANQYGLTAIKFVCVDYNGTEASECKNTIISDNKMTGQNDLFEIGVGSGGSRNEHSHDIIVERNWWAGAGTNQPDYLNGTEISFRNNVIDMGSYSGGWPILVRNEYPGQSPNPNNIWIYNNSIYESASASGYNVLQLGDGGHTGAIGNVYFKNNIAYLPNSTSVNIVGNSFGTGATVIAGNNTSGTGCGSNCVGSISTNPFTSVSPFTPTNAKPAAGSYAIGAGASVPLWADFFNVAQPSSRDVGAVVH
jgi:hypothetical protein